LVRGAHAGGAVAAVGGSPAFAQTLSRSAASGEIRRAAWVIYVPGEPVHGTAPPALFSDRPPIQA
ncbi:hypothetical protein AB4084_25265, partial [Lysobacter sp. 2RAB21]